MKHRDCEMIGSHDPHQFVNVNDMGCLVNCAGVVPDMVNHPPHYGAHPSGVECIQVTEWMNFNLGNAVKYLWRADMKNGLEDLKKAQWYLNREIARLEKSPDV